MRWLLLLLLLLLPLRCCCMGRKIDRGGWLWLVVDLSVETLHSPSHAASMPASPACAVATGYFSYGSVATLLSIYAAYVVSSGR